MLQSLKEMLAMMEKESVADTQFLAEKGKSLSKKSHVWERAAGYVLQGLSYVHRAAVAVFFGFPQKIITRTPASQKPVPRKAKIGFLHEPKTEPTTRKAKIGFLHEPKTEPTSRKEQGQIGFVSENNPRPSYPLRQLKVARVRLVRLLVAAALVGTAFAQKETSQDPKTNESKSVVRVGTLGVTLMAATVKGNKDTDFNVQMIGAEKAKKVMNQLIHASAFPTNETPSKTISPQVLSKKSERDH